jgi:hypothetical protein
MSDTEEKQEKTLLNLVVFTADDTEEQHCNAIGMRRMIEILLAKGKLKEVPTEVVVVPDSLSGTLKFRVNDLYVTFLPYDQRPFRHRNILGITNEIQLSNVDGTYNCELIAGDAYEVDPSRVGCVQLKRDEITELMMRTPYHEVAFVIQRYWRQQPIAYNIPKKTCPMTLAHIADTFSTTWETLARGHFLDYPRFVASIKEVYSDFSWPEKRIRTWRVSSHREWPMLMIDGFIKYKMDPKNPDVETPFKLMLRWRNDTLEFFLKKTERHYYDLLRDPGSGGLYLLIEDLVSAKKQKVSSLIFKEKYVEATQIILEELVENKSIKERLVE